MLIGFAMSGGKSMRAWLFRFSLAAFVVLTAAQTTAERFLHHHISPECPALEGILKRIEETLRMNERRKN